MKRLIDKAMITARNDDLSHCVWKCDWTFMRPEVVISHDQNLMRDLMQD